MGYCAVMLEGDDGRGVRVGGEGGWRGRLRGRGFMGLGDGGWWMSMHLALLDPTAKKRVGC